MSDNVKNAIILKYGELALRGNNRYLFENKLIAGIRRSINEAIAEHSLSMNYKVKKEQGRLLILPVMSSSSDNDSESSLEKEINTLVPGLKMIIGLIGICPCVRIDNDDIEYIRDSSLRYMKEYHGKTCITFKVETRRSNKRYPIKSQEISAMIGGYLLENMDNLKVDVHNPDVILYIELRNDIYIYTNAEKGIGGLPVGSSGRGMLLLSGGIDSPVAGYLTAKRGVELEAVYFHSPPYTSERAKLKVIDLVKKLSAYAGDIRLHVVLFTDIQIYLRDNVPEDKLTIFLKRAMLRIAQEIAEANKCKVLINGDSIGQVASQNLSSMVAIGSATAMPLLRPLAGFDKQEIVDLAIKLGTYEISIRPYDDCCTLFVAKHPELSPKLSVIEGIERGLQELPDLIAEAIKSSDIRENCTTIQ